MVDVLRNSFFKKDNWWLKGKLPSTDCTSIVLTITRREIDAHNESYERIMKEVVVFRHIPALFHMFVLYAAHTRICTQCVLCTHLLPCYFLLSSFLFFLRYNIVEYGRRNYREIIYCSDVSLCLTSMKPNLDTGVRTSLVDGSLRIDAGSPTAEVMQFIPR